MFSINTPKTSQIGDTVDCRIDTLRSLWRPTNAPEKLTWKDANTLVIEPDEAVAILHTRIDGDQRVFVCAEPTSTEGYIVSVRRLYERRETPVDEMYVPERFSGGVGLAEANEAPYWDVSIIKRDMESGEPLAEGIIRFDPKTNDVTWFCNWGRDGLASNLKSNLKQTNVPRLDRYLWKNKK
jgi:hypothetical protein